jgi:DNA-binding transcriptional MerR regulator
MVDILPNWRFYRANRECLLIRRDRRESIPETGGHNMDDHAVAEESRSVETLDLLTIGELSQRHGITLRALRFYEARGLLSPQRAGAVRLYGPADARRLELILKGKHLGFTLAEIREMVATSAQDAIAQPELAIAPDLVVAQLETLRRQRVSIEEAIVELEAAHQRMALAPGAMIGLAASGAARAISTHAA